MTLVQLQRHIYFTISTKNALSKTQVIKYSCILLSVFVGWFTKCKDVHGVSNIKDTFLYARLLYILTIRSNLLTP